MNKDEIMEMLNTLKNKFREVSMIAWNNCPDADEDSMNDFSSSMNNAENVFNNTFDALVERLGDL